MNRSKNKSILELIVEGVFGSHLAIHSLVDSALLQNNLTNELDRKKISTLECYELSGDPFVVKLDQDGNMIDTFMSIVHIENKEVLIYKGTDQYIIKTPETILRMIRGFRIIIDEVIVESNVIDSCKEDLCIVSYKKSEKNQYYFLEVSVGSVLVFQKMIKDTGFIAVISKDGGRKTIPYPYLIKRVNTTKTPKKQTKVKERVPELVESN